MRSSDLFTEKEETYLKAIQKFDVKKENNPVIVGLLNLLKKVYDGVKITLKDNESLLSLMEDRNKEIRMITDELHILKEKNESLHKNSMKVNNMNNLLSEKLVEITKTLGDMKNSYNDLVLSSGEISFNTIIKSLEEMKEDDRSNGIGITNDIGNLENISMQTSDSEINDIFNDEKNDTEEVFSFEKTKDNIDNDNEPEFSFDQTV